MHLSATLLLPFSTLMVYAYPGTPTYSTCPSGNSSSPTGDLSPPTVTLDYSTIVPAAGNSSLGYYKYQNIRYAAVPTGDLRWAKPQWPPQESAINNGSLANADVDCSSEEDCLYMDIWAPANSQNKSLPVLVWTYGGTRSSK